MSGKDREVHLCYGFHTPEEGTAPHACRCPIGHDHSLIEYRRFDHDREDD